MKKKINNITLLMLLIFNACQIIHTNICNTHIYTHYYINSTSNDFTHIRPLDWLCK